MKKLLYILLLLAGFSLLSCETESYYESNDARLHFSVDTLTFDTVFTKTGSITKRFKVYNTYSKDLKLSKITLSGADTSPFRMNVDGVIGNVVEDMVIRKRDSMYVFVEVTINPSDIGLPFIVNDSIIFETNGNSQKVQLVAYGQNVNRIKREADSNIVYIDADKKIEALALSDMVFTNSVPYLIQTNICIDSLATLRVESGAIIYMAKDVNLFVKGTLVISGTNDDRVVVRGDRLDQLYDGKSYDKVPGQWGGIYLMKGSSSNLIEYTDIRNGRIGIQLDSIVDLSISYSTITNMSTMALYAMGSSIHAANCVFSNCGQSIVALYEGGSYLFDQCTIAGYYDWAARKNPSLIINNYVNSIDNNLAIRALNRAEFNNCVVYGNNRAELFLDKHEDSTDDQFSFKFNHCLLRVENSFDTTLVTHYINTIWNKSPKFISIKEPYNFQPDSLSPLVGKADLDIAINYKYDLNGNDRFIDDKADIGAFEFIPKASE